MNNKIIYIVLGILLIGLMGYYGVYQPCTQIMPNIEQKNAAEARKEKAEIELKKAEANYRRVMREREERKKNIERNRGSLKQIYEVESLPSFMDKDSIFGKMLHDIINMAKKNGLKVRSMVFYSDIEKEPLVLGRDVSIETELANMVNNKEGTDDKSNQENAEQETPQTDYKAYQVDFSFASSYGNLNAFMKAVKNYKYLIKVRKLETYPYPENPKILMSNVSLILYAKIK